MLRRHETKPVIEEELVVAVILFSAMSPFKVDTSDAYRRRLLSTTDWMDSQASFTSKRASFSLTHRFRHWSTPSSLSVQETERRSSCRREAQADLLPVEPPSHESPDR
ncbi:hypothetical protein BaRGS_00036137 [Batillaria attramentaria]|uniref:Uncharacterized protein n=1 Tax=Batillaria attramentaria TaxID=370345 RepID=A0ABD0JCA8_9CAEN